MTDVDTLRDIVRAIALGEGESANQLQSQLDDAGHEELYEFATAAMSVLLEQRFQDDASPAAIQQFAEQMRYDFRHAERPVKPLMVEALIRAFAGEEHLLEDVPAEEQMHAQYPIIRKIVGESPELQARIDEVLHDAQLLVDSWSEED